MHAQPLPVHVADVRIGISGWTYKPWRGQFYPEGLPQKKELAYAASIFRSIEINGTFYSMQRCESFAHGPTRRPTTSSSRSRARAISPTC